MALTDRYVLIIDLRSDVIIWWQALSIEGPNIRSIELYICFDMTKKSTWHMFRIIHTPDDVSQIRNFVQQKC